MRGLLVIEPLYHKIVAGDKNQTRRSGGLDEVNGRKATKTKPAILTNPDNWEILYTKDSSNNERMEVHFVTKDRGILIEALDERKPKNIKCFSRYHIGEVLYLKEPVSFEGVYKFDTSESDRDLLPWQNKLFMSASAARAFIKITGIRCERLLDISDADCIAEGIEYYLPNGTVAYKLYQKKWLTQPTENSPGGYVLFTTEPKESFLSLYKFANKVKEIPNLWVWVYEFEYLKDYQHGH